MDTYRIDYYRTKDGVKVTATFSTKAAAIQWAKDTGRPGSRIY